MNVRPFSSAGKRARQAQQWPALLDTWLARWAEDLGGPLDPRMADVAADVIETVVTRPASTAGAVRRMGLALGSDGWPLEHVNRWLRFTDGLLPRPATRILASFDTTAALAEGWAEAFVRGAQSSVCIEPITGLTTQLVLNLRLREVFNQERAAGSHAPSTYCIVVVDADVNALSPFERDAVLITLAAETTTLFAAGETISRVGHRVLVLARRNIVTVENIDVLTQRLDDLVLPNAASTMVWMDELPSSPSAIDAYLRDAADVRI